MRYSKQSFLYSIQVFTLFWSSSAAQNPGITWSACGDSSLPRECGQFEVPLDYHDTTAGNAQLSVIRFNSTKSPRLGTLFVNPGGPGNGGVEWLLGDDLTLLAERSGGQYDIVSWDPRGTGTTSPRATCFYSLEDAKAFWNGSIRGGPLEVRGDFLNITEREDFYSHVDEVDSALVRFFERCDNKSMDTFKYMGTPATVRDMVMLHDYIEGSGPINYWGFSYGTLLGNYFVNMFPERVGRVIIDGVLNPWVWSGKPPLDTLSVILTSTNDVFEGFAEHCAAAGPSKCAVAQNGSTSESITQWTRDLIERAYDHTKATGGTVTTSGALRAQIWAGMYRPNAWKTFAEYLSGISAALYNSTESATSHNLRARDDNSTSTDPNLDFSGQAITCADAVNSSSVTTKDVFEFVVNVTQTRSRILAPVTWLLPDVFCHQWPAPAVERYTGPFNRTLSNPILVIGNEYDPVTPLVSAEHVASAFGESAVLLKRNTYGHTSLGTSSNCTDNAVQNYLNKNELPEGGLACEIDQPLF